MLKELLDRIIDLKREEIVDVEKRKYSTHKLNQIKEPSADKLCLHTLTGLVDYVKNNIDELTKGEFFFHVLQHNEIKLYSSINDLWNDRDCYLYANSDLYEHNFNFGSKYDVERFIINLQSQFKATPDRDKILKLVGNLTASKVQTSTDDGVTQTVGTKAGVQLRQEAELPNPVKLKPYRTFLEIEQPESQFIFRVYQPIEGALPTCSLHEADGGLWKIEAIQKIKKYLTDNLEEIIVIA